jgi:hypothetical protein
VAIRSVSRVHRAGSQSLDIDDPISGCTFHFPQGGSGKFRVFSIADGPELGIDASQPFYVDYLGTGEVEIRIPVDPEERTTLLYYGEIDNAAIHKSDGNIGWWTMLESAVEDSEAVYPLAAFSTKLQKAAAGGLSTTEQQGFCNQPNKSRLFRLDQTDQSVQHGAASYRRLAQPVAGIDQYRSASTNPG